jgi:GNAT superfamily N-acetyltransferase
MALRKHAEGRLVVEQARDRETVRAMLSGARMLTDGIDWQPACYLVAYFGDDPVGVVGVESRVDAALIRSLLVAEPMRRRGIGAALIVAARKAAHTRGARTLYAFSTEAGDYFRRFGFEPAPVDELVAALRGAPQVEYYMARPDELRHERAWKLDISHDGIVAR